MIRATTRIALFVALATTLLVGRVEAQSIFIENATVWTTPDKKLSNASVLIRNGLVTAVGKVSAPAGARRIDARGKVVTAGLIDASTRIGLQEVMLVSSTNEGSFHNTNGRRGVVAAYRVVDGYNASSVSIPLARTHGVTAVVSVPVGAFVSGIAGAFSMVDGVAKSEISREVGLYTNLGRAALGSNGGSRGMAIARLRELFDDAERYSRNKAAFERNQSRKLAASRLDLEALLLVKRRAIPLVVRANRASDLRAALRLARDLRIRLILSGATEAWQLAAEIAKADVPVLLDPTSNLPSSFDRIHVREDSAKRLADAGVRVIVSTLGEAANVRNLRQRAGIAVAHGLSWSQALAAVTTNPAIAFGLGKRGTIAAGSVADVVVWSGDPFEISSAAEAVIIGGVVQSLRTRQTELRERYRKLPATRR